MITDWVDFIGSSYACHQKRRSGKASDEAEIGPGCFLGIRKKKDKTGGNKMARESKGLTLKEKREEGRKFEEEMIILIAGQGDQRSFKLSSCGAKILTGDNRFQKWTAHGGRIVNPLVCLSFPLPYPPHFPPSPRLRPPSPHHLSLISIIVCSSIVRLSPPFPSLLFSSSKIDAVTIIHAQRDPQPQI